MRRSHALPLPVARRAAWRVRPLRNARLPLWIWVALFGLTLAALLPVLQSSAATSAGAQLTALERERDRLEAEVRLLSSQVGQLAAISRVEQVAKERLGLTPARPTVVLEVASPPPARVLPDRFLPQRTAATDVERPAWQRLVDLLILR